MARRAEERLNGRMDELRRLLAQADAAAARPGGAYVPQDASSPAEQAAPPAILEKQRDQIFRLRLQGLEPIDIARRMRVPVGEVELTLKLRKAQQEHARAAADSPGA
jgi:DNA-directed RNA polymerase specialized sigma24 family protein